MGILLFTLGKILLSRVKNLTSVNVQLVGVTLAYSQSEDFVIENETGLKIRSHTFVADDFGFPDDKLVAG